MRILLLPHRFLPERGGVETWTEGLARALLDLGHEPAVLTRDETPRADLPAFACAEDRHALPDGRELAVHRIVHRHALARDARETWDDRRFDAPLLSVLRRTRPDVVHLAHPDGWGVRPAEAARRLGLPLVGTLHDYKWICDRGRMLRPDGERCRAIDPDRCTACVARQLDRGPIRGALHRLGDRLGLRPPPPGSDRPASPLGRRRWETHRRAALRLLEDLDLLTSPSAFVAERHREAGLRRPVRVIRHGLDAGPPPPLPEGPPVLGFFGTPTPGKGLALLVDAVAALAPGSLRLELHGPAPGDLPPLPPHAVAFGPYPPEEAAARMARVHAVVVPSRWDENAPMVAVEARAAGRPLLVSDRGGLPELVDPGVDGWVLPAEDRRAWIAFLASPELGDRLGAAARRVRPPPSSRSVGLAYEAVYREALAGRGAASAGGASPSA